MVHWIANLSRETTFWRRRSRLKSEPIVGGIDSFNDAMLSQRLFEHEQSWIHRWYLRWLCPERDSRVSLLASCVLITREWKGTRGDQWRVTSIVTTRLFVCIVSVSRMQQESKKYHERTSIDRSFQSLNSLRVNFPFLFLRSKKSEHPWKSLHWSIPIKSRCFYRERVTWCEDFNRRNWMETMFDNEKQENLANARRKVCSFVSLSLRKTDIDSLIPAS